VATNVGMVSIVEGTPWEFFQVLILQLKYLFVLYFLLVFILHELAGRSDYKLVTSGKPSSVKIHIRGEMR
jgi:hypothetical protein